MNHFYPTFEKELLNRYLACKGNIRVFIRVRPVLNNDYSAYAGTKDQFDTLVNQIKIPNSQQISVDMSLSVQNQASNVISQKQQTTQVHLFNFDAVFDQKSSQG